jgi:hypothetical protein
VSDMPPSSGQMLGRMGGTIGSVHPDLRFIQNIASKSAGDIGRGETHPLPCLDPDLVRFDAR